MGPNLVCSETLGKGCLLLSWGGSQCTPGKGSPVWPGSCLFLLPSQQVATILDSRMWSLWISCALLLSLEAGTGPASESRRTDTTAAASDTTCSITVSLVLSPSESAARWLKSSALLCPNLGTSLGICLGFFSACTRRQSWLILFRVPVRMG